ncbi:MAG: hypothetical protein DSY46_01895, partial [Hydrogenimonas sp.]
MFLKDSKIGILLIFISVLLLGLNIYGVLSPNDYRDKFDKKILSYKETLNKIDTAYKKYGKTEKFLAKAVEIYNQ